jgi:hypothetical protein
VPEYRMQRQLVSTRRGTVALGAATLPYEELFDRAWVKYLFENLFQNSIDFAQREYWFAIFEWMPRIKKLVLRDPVGVPSSCCTIGSGHIVLWTKMRRSAGQFSGPELSLQIRSLADFVTTTSEARFSLHTGGRGS